MAKQIVFIEGRRDGYSPEQCGRTLTVQELIEVLEEMDPEAKVYLKNDNGYTYGSITHYSFEEEQYEVDGEEDDE